MRYVFIAIIIFFLGLGVFFIGRSISSKNKHASSNIAPTKPIVIPTDEPLVTPTIVPSSKSDLKTFVFPDTNTRYSFEYPSAWSVVELGHNNIVRLNFTGHCKVEFSTGEEKSTVDQTAE